MMECNVKDVRYGSNFGSNLGSNLNSNLGPNLPGFNLRKLMGKVDFFNQQM